MLKRIQGTTAHCYLKSEFNKLRKKISFNRSKPFFQEESEQNPKKSKPKSLWNDHNDQESSSKIKPSPNNSISKSLQSSDNNKFTELYKDIINKRIKNIFFNKILKLYKTKVINILNFNNVYKEKQIYKNLYIKRFSGYFIIFI